MPTLTQRQAHSRPEKQPSQTRNATKLKLDYLQPMPKQRCCDTRRSRHHTQTKRTGRETNIIHQAASSAFPMAPLFLPLHLSVFSFRVPILRGRSSTFLLLHLVVVPIKMQTIALPHPGIAASKLLSTSQSSFAKRASGLRAGSGGWGAEITSLSEHKVGDESPSICLIDRGKVELPQSS